MQKPYLNIVFYTEFSCRIPHAIKLLLLFSCRLPTTHQLLGGRIYSIVYTNQHALFSKSGTERRPCVCCSVLISINMSVSHPGLHTLHHTQMAMTTNIYRHNVCVYSVCVFHGHLDHNERKV